MSYQSPSYTLQKQRSLLCGIFALKHFDVKPQPTDYTQLIPSWLLNSSNFSVVVTDMSGCYVFVNQPFSKRYAFLGDKLIGQSIVNSVHPDDLPTIGAAVEQCIANPDEIVSVVIRKPEQTEGVYYSSIWDFSLLRDHDGQPVGILSIGADLTEKQAISLKLHQFQARFDHMVDEMDVGFIEVDQNWDMLRVNAAAKGILNATNDEVVGTSIWNYFDRPIEESCECPLRYAMENLQGAHARMTLNNKHQWVDVHAQPSVGGLTLFLRDITFEVQRIEQLDTLHTQTLHQNERLKNFAHIVSHNLRSHASNISSLLNFIKQDTPEWTTGEIPKMLFHAADRLHETVHSLSDVAFLSLEPQDSFEVLNLRTLVTKAIDTVAGQTCLHGVTIHNAVNNTDVMRVIPAYIDSILLNLLTNAIRYRDPNRPCEITIDAHASERFMQVRVADNGLGIDLNRHRGKIFGMYKTFHDLPDSKGLGLFITKNQVEAMGGYIDVESTPNVGSLFTVAIPL
jgi:PAS domain S-box-containing protein